MSEYGSPPYRYLEVTEKPPWGSYGTLPNGLVEHFKYELPENTPSQLFELTLSAWKQESPLLPRYMADVFADPAAIRWLSDPYGLDGGVAIGADLPTRMARFAYRPEQEQWDWDNAHNIHYLMHTVTQASDIHVLDRFIEMWNYYFSFFVARPEGGMMDLPASAAFWTSLIDYSIDRTTEDAIILIQTNVLGNDARAVQAHMEDLRFHHPDWHVRHGSWGRSLVILKDPKILHR